MMDCGGVSRALAKTLAYKACGKHGKANALAAVVRLLEREDILHSPIDVYRVFPTAAAAQKVVDGLNGSEPESWSYDVLVDPKGSGRAIIKVYDELGNFVSNL